MNLQRIRGIFFRHLYLWRHPEYFFDTFWQPLVEVFIWGFVSLYLSRTTVELSSLQSIFLGGVILWAVLRRGQHETTFTLMEDAWSRNLQNILITPITMADYYAASILFSVLKLIIELSFMAVLAALIFKINVLNLGLSFFALAFNLLLTGWALGLVVNAAIIYYGRGLVALSWIMAFVIQPFSCVFYPLSVLPPWAKVIAMAFPPTWVFENLRQIIHGDGLSLVKFIYAFGLNGIYIFAAALLFRRVMRVALEKGLLLKLEW